MGEHCVGCAQHAMTTRHDEAKYIGVAEQFRDIVANELPGCHVLINPENAEHTLKPRLGSFEIVARWRHGGRRYESTVFSKIKDRKFPNVAKVVEDLGKVLPARFNVNIQV